MHNINPDKATLALAQLVLAQAEADRDEALAARSEFEKRNPGATAGWPEPPPLPTLEQVLEQSARIGLRALGRGALNTHQRADRNANPGAGPGHHGHGCGGAHELLEHAYHAGPSGLTANY